MREIKFRYWNYMKRQMSHQDIHGVALGYLGTNLQKEHLMQYTGLKDSQGNEIYEGDILDFDEREWGGKFQPEVIEMDKIIGDWQYCGSLRDVAEWRTVIGNFYENPELIT